MNSELIIYLRKTISQNLRRKLNSLGLGVPAYENVTEAAKSRLQKQCQIFIALIYTIVYIKYTIFCQLFQHKLNLKVTLFLR